MSAELAKHHWKWATNALSAAIRDAIHHDPRNAVSRAYYAMFHAANAALAIKGLHPKTHNGTQALFNKHLVGPGAVDKQRGRDLAKGQERRTNADYDVVRDISEQQADEQCARGAAFLTEMRTHLRQAGLGEHELGAVPPLPGSKPPQPGGDPGFANPGARPRNPGSTTGGRPEVPEQGPKR